MKVEKSIGGYLLWDAGCRPVHVHVNQTEAVDGRIGVGMR
jgi:hypothetical protein